MNLDNFRSNKNSEKSTNSFVSSFLKTLENFLSNSPQFYTIDRIEGNFAICENRKTLKMVNIPLENLPKNISTNVVLKFENGIYSINYDKTQEIKNTISRKSKNLWK